MSGSERANRPSEERLFRGRTSARPGVCNLVTQLETNQKCRRQRPGISELYYGKELPCFTVEAGLDSAARLLPGTGPERETQRGERCIGMKKTNQGVHGFRSTEFAAKQLPRLALAASAGTRSGIPTALSEPGKHAARSSPEAYTACRHPHHHGAWRCTRGEQTLREQPRRAVNPASQLIA
jgi:hypothetical protein